MNIQSKEDIQFLIDNSIEEGTELEYKRAFPKPKENQKQKGKEELAKDISAMANANGGTNPNKIDNRISRPTDFQQKCRLSVGLLFPK